MWAQVITAIISGLLGAGVASVVAPWSNWGVEKRRSDRQYRRDLIRDWRDGVPYGLDRSALHSGPGSAFDRGKPIADHPSWTA